MSFRDRIIKLLGGISLSEHGSILDRGSKTLAKALVAKGLVVYTGKTGGIEIDLPAEGDSGSPYSVAMFFNGIVYEVRIYKQTSCTLTQLTSKGFEAFGTGSLPPTFTIPIDSVIEVCDAFRAYSTKLNTKARLASGCVE